MTWQKSCMVGKLDMERLEVLVVADIEEKEAIPIIRTNGPLGEMFTCMYVESACCLPQCGLHIHCNVVSTSIAIGDKKTQHALVHASNIVCNVYYRDFHMGHLTQAGWKVSHVKTATG